MNFDKLKNLMEHFVEEGYAPGNGILVYLDGKPVYEYACGYSDIESKTPMTGKEYFNLYSCSKIATVTAALQLVEQGKILLTDPLYDYIPEYKEMYIKQAGGEMVKAEKPILIQHLFNMTAGFDYDRSSEPFKRARELTNGNMDTEVVVRQMAKKPLHFEPGTRFQYSVCHEILAGLVEIVSGKKFRDYMQENIFDPLGMDQAVYHHTPEVISKMATQYIFVANSQEKELDYVEAQKFGNAKSGHFERRGYEVYDILGPEYDSGGAGIITTAQDYIKLAAALANWGMGLTGNRILSPGTVELLRTNTLDKEQRKDFDWGQLAGYGYGLGVRTLIDRAAAGFTGKTSEFGWGGAAGTSVYIDPEINMAAVYVKHSLSPREEYYQPRVRNVIYTCLEK